MVEFFCQRQGYGLVMETALYQFYFEPQLRPYKTWKHRLHHQCRNHFSILWRTKKWVARNIASLKRDKRM